MKTKILILLLTSFLFISCNEDDNPFTLPDATQIGANTAGCYIDGDLYVLKNVVKNSSWLGSSKTVQLEYEYDEDYQLWYMFIYVKIEGRDNYSRNLYLKLKSTNELKAKEYKLLNYEEGKQYAEIFGRDLKKDGTNSFETAWTTDTEAGHIKITKLDKKNNLISGTFSFKAKLQQRDDIINVTNGRFDLKIPKK